MSSLLSSTAEKGNSSSSSSKIRTKESSSSKLMTGRKRNWNDDNNNNNEEEDGDSGSIPWLCWNHDWKGVCKRLESHPEEAQWTVSLSLRKVEKIVGSSLSTKNSSPLALACRYDAPLQVIQGLMEAAPERLSEMTPNRGTPIHDAAYVCTKLDVWSYLLSFSSKDNNICAMQDVDGHVPLHILVKRTLSSTTTPTTTETMELRLQMLQVLVQTYPPAVSMSNHDEYRETPLITALKSSCTSTSSGGNLVEKEKWIFQVVQIMLQAYPSAAIHPIPSKEYYTAIHSAVFHGRSAEILYLLLHSDTTDNVNDIDVVDIPNSLQETPLHIACMRGEGIKTLQYLVTPSTLLSRDANSLTPLHWLWIRHVDQTFEFHQQQPPPEEPQDFSFLISTSPSSPVRTNNNSIDEDYFCHVQKLDPPVDHRRMRHIPEHYYISQQEVMEQTIASLQSSNNLTPPDRNVYFWSKVTKLLSLSSSSSSLLLHTACQLPSCIAIIQILLQLYPHHTSIRHTSNGNLPIHSIALRRWHPKEVRSIPQQPSNHFAVDNNEDAIFNALNNSTNQQQPLFDPDYRIFDYVNTTNNNNNNSTLSTRILLQQEMDKSRNIIYLEPYHILKLILQASDKRVCRTYNNEYQLPLHCAIDTLPSTTTTTSDDILQLYTTFLDILSCYISQYPEALSRRDGKSKLYPFAQIIASCTQNNQQLCNDVNEKDENNFNLLPLSLSYKLLRDNPSVLLH